MGAYRVTGTTDEITTCDVCGREELRGTVRLVIGDEEGEIFAGTSCAAKLAGTTVKDIKAGVVEAAKAAEYAAQLAHEAEYAACEEWLRAHSLVRNFANVKAWRATR